MRIIDTTAGVPIIITSYENDVLQKCSDWVSESSLGEFDGNVADRLVSRGLMERNAEDDTKYRSIKVNKLWRI